MCDGYRRLVKFRSTANPAQRKCRAGDRGWARGGSKPSPNGVIAIVITIMVLDMKVPAGADFAALRSTLPIFLVYAPSYTNVGG
jgi:hypothetical protein